ncbi:MAG: hypothetical protein HY938_01215 [Nitrosomonadales bacterium]|nr:hypothetical protein [Nitrosomonadales bacterium]
MSGIQAKTIIIRRNFSEETKGESLMKCIKVLSGIFISVISPSALAGESNHGDYSLSIGGSHGLSIRKDLSESTQIYTSFGLDNVTDFSNGGNINYYRAALGLKRHLYTTQYSDRFSTYLDAALEAYYFRVTGPQSNRDSSNTYSVGSSYVFEYYLSPNLSITAEAGLVASYQHRSDTYTSSYSFRHLFFPTTATALIYYW